jgi:hypothetical protein
MKDSEQAACEEWCERQCPSGDVDEVHRQWKDSYAHDCWIDDIHSEIKEKYLSLREVYVTLVGALYPSIAYRELCELRDAYIRLGGSSENLPWTAPPRGDGRAPW